MNIQVLDIDYEKYMEIPYETRKEPDFSKITFKLKLGTKIGIVWKDDKKYYDEDACDYYASWDDYKKDVCHSALIVPHPNIEARGGIDPSEAILCFYDYPCEKENPRTDFVTANKVFMNEDIYEVFEL